MGGVDGFCQMQFYYGADLQRLMQVRKKGGTVTRTLYLGAYEVREVYGCNEDEPGPTNLLEREERSSFGNGAQVRLANVGNGFAAGRKLEFSLKDHLGSTSAVHDESGEVQKSRGQQPTDERHSYDAWGARRDNASWAPAGPMLGHSPPPTANSSPPTEPKVASSQPRGFTGHEMLDDVGLVHMNGRLYDAALGRFCSADPIIQEGENSQNYNRYTYVLNNPLSHTDPSGFSFWKKFVRALVAIIIVIIIVVIVLITYGAGMTYLSTLAGAWSAGGISGVGTVVAASTTLQIAAGAIVGGSFAAINAAVRGASMSETIRAAAQGALTGAISAGVANVIGNAFQGVTGFAGKVMHSAAHGVAGGAMTEAQGGNFKDGFIGSLIGSGVSYVTGGLLPGMDRIKGLEGVALRTAVSAASGGVASMLAGGKFADGAYSAAFFHLFNDTMHDTGSRDLSVSEWWQATKEGIPKGVDRWWAMTKDMFQPGTPNGDAGEYQSGTFEDQWVGWANGVAIVSGGLLLARGGARLLPSASQRYLARMVYDTRQFKSISSAYWRARGGANGMHLHHWLIPQRMVRAMPFLRPIANSRLNLIAVPGGFNSWMGYSSAGRAVELGLRITIPTSIGAGAWGGFNLGEKLFGE